MSQAALRDDFPPDWCSFAKFREGHPHLHTSDDALRWELRFRHENGLISEDVVVERRADPNASRPMILISPSRYFSRLVRRSKGVA